MINTTGSAQAIRGLALAAVTVLAISPVDAQEAKKDVMLVPHRAVYDLKLGKAQGKRALEAVRGRILYDFSGSACEGYSLQFRQVSELDSGEGKVAVSDLKSTTWEGGDAKNFRFQSENVLNGQKQTVVEGRADRNADEVAVTLTKPSPKKFELSGKVVFPTEHVWRAIRDARNGKTLLELQVYDGSDNGEKVYDSLTVLGRSIGPGQREPNDAAAGHEALKGLTRWPVTVSYFEKDSASGTGEQTPAYAISFELYENGISRALVLDYGDFTVLGELKQLDVRPAKPCP